MYWYKVRINDGTERGYTFVGSSPKTLEELVSQAESGQYIRLDDLLYHDRGEVKEWEEWDKREVPTICINPSQIIAIQPFKGDPRTLTK